MSKRQQPAVGQARQGNPAAICELLRQQLRRPDVKIRVTRKGTLLCIDFDGDRLPPKQELLRLVARTLRHVVDSKLTAAQVRSRAAGHESSNWLGRILLQRPQSRFKKTFMGRLSRLARSRTGRLSLSTLLLVLLGTGWAKMQRSPQTALEFATRPQTKTLGQPEKIGQGTDAQVTEAEAPLDDGLIRIGDLSPHRLREQEIFEGKRIQIDTNDADLSREGCMALVDYYLEAAGGPDGKVVVQKPNPKSPWNGKRAPYCENNLDGVGTYFNDAYFDEAL